MSIEIVRLVRFAALLLLLGIMVPLPAPAQEVAVTIEMASGRLLPPWRLHRDAGRPSFEVHDAGRHVRLRCEDAAFGPERPLLLGPAETPVLRWEWRAESLPPAGDEHGASLMVFFERPGLGQRAIRYAWDSAEATGDTLAALDTDELDEVVAAAPPLEQPAAPPPARAQQRKMLPPAIQLRTVVAEAGRGGLGAWRTVERDLLVDFREQFGEEPGRVTGIRFQTECRRSGAVADVAFRAVRFGQREGGTP